MKFSPVDAAAPLQQSAALDDLQRNARAGTRGEAQAVEAAPSAQVSLSSASGALRDPSQDVDLVKVAALRDALAAGTYQPDPQRIASGLLDDACQLGGLMPAADAPAGAAPVQGDPHG